MGYMRCVSWDWVSCVIIKMKKWHLVFDLNLVLPLSRICVTSLGTHKYIIFQPAPC